MHASRSAMRALLGLALVAGALTVVGCGGSNGAGDAQSPAAPTAPATTAPPTPTAPATTPAAPPAPLRPGDVAAGKAVFASSCDTCHAGLGTRKYVGPKLAGLGLSAAFIRERVVQGKSPMPAGLVQGQDLADVVAFVRGIQ
jgi:mono/diheme cytochrome c family protein